MKPIEKDELYQHLHEFLKSKGIEMTDGSYAERVQKGCGLLTDVVNLTQRGVEKARNEIDKRLDQMRQIIHEKTAPNSRRSAPPGSSASTQTQTTAGPSPTKARRKQAKTENRQSKRRRKA